MADKDVDDLEQLGGTVFSKEVEFTDKRKKAAKCMG